MRSTQDHTLHHMFDDVAAAAGFSRDDIVRWGGSIEKTGSVPWTHTETFKSLVEGRIDALFDEAAHSWVPQASEAGITILPLAEATVTKLEAMGYRRAILPTSAYPKLPRDVLTLDFSGWTVFVHEAADDKLVEQICAGLEARKARDRLGGAATFTGRAHGERGARHAANRCASPGGRALIGSSRGFL